MKDSSPLALVPCCRPSDALVAQPKSTFAISHILLRIFDFVSAPWCYWKSKQLVTLGLHAGSQVVPLEVNMGQLLSLPVNLGQPLGNLCQATKRPHKMVLEVLNIWKPDRLNWHVWYPLKFKSISIYMDTANKMKRSWKIPLAVEWSCWKMDVAKRRMEGRKLRNFLPLKLI